MTAVIHRPLVVGEESLFDSLPDPFPSVPKMSYAEGLAAGGFDPARTWVSLRGGRVVARAAWVLPPGSVGRPWLERFDLAGSPEVGAALLSAAHEALGGPCPYYAALPVDWRSSRALVEDAFAAAELAGLAPRGERLRFARPATPPDDPAALQVRPATCPAEINALVARIAVPDVLTGGETALAVANLDLARNPLPWLTGEATAWHVACDGDTPLGLAGTAGEACWPMLGYLGVLSDAARPALLAAAVSTLLTGGAEQVVADADAGRPDVIADLERSGFRRIRARMTFRAAAAS